MQSASHPTSALTKDPPTLGESCRLLKDHRLPWRGEGRALGAWGGTVGGGVSLDLKSTGYRSRKEAPAPFTRC